MGTNAISSEDLNGLAKAFENKISAIKAETDAVHELRKQFVEDYSVNRIPSMEIDDYVIGKKGITGKESFCYRIEQKLKGLGSIAGSFAEKFGLYYSLKDQDYRISSTRKFGGTVEEAFDTIKGELVRLIDAGERGDLEAIRTSKLSPNFRAKVLATYYPDDYLGIFDESHLKYFLGKIGIAYEKNEDKFSLQNKLVAWMRGQERIAEFDLTLFSAFLYESFGNPSKWGKKPAGALGLADGKDGESTETPLNTVLYGPPGTGKTYMTTRLALEALGVDVPESHKDLKAEYAKYAELGQIQFVTFHQSYSYEDFVQGLFPVRLSEEGGGRLAYHVKSGAFKTLCDAAAGDPDENYVFVIDEMNRGNVPAIFGELITLLEEDKRLGGGDERTVRLPYVDEETKTDEWGVPGNVHVIATMNTADRSLVQLDAAIRRRFRFVEVMPDYNALEERMAELASRPEGTDLAGVDVALMLKAMNRRICALYDRDHQIGHSYFWNVGSLDDLRDVFAHDVMPLLQDYFYEDYSLVKAVLNDRDGAFVKVDEVTVGLLGLEWLDLDRPLEPSYEITDQTGWDAGAFIGIYDDAAYQN